MGKVCSKCKINKPLEDYYKDVYKKDGRTSSCKICNDIKYKKYYIEHKQQIAKHLKKYQKKRVEKHKKAWMPILKEIYGTIACTKCGYDKCFAALDFHHRKGETKKFGIAIILACKVTAKRIKEIKKCDILCANCHRELHNGY
jgi:hypothetical protein